MKTLECFECGPKAICLFSPSQMKMSRPRCMECLKKKNREYKATQLGRPSGQSGTELWRKNMQLHFR